MEKKGFVQVMIFNLGEKGKKQSNNIWTNGSISEDLIAFVEDNHMHWSDVGWVRFTVLICACLTLTFPRPHFHMHLLSRHSVVLRSYEFFCVWSQTCSSNLFGKLKRREMCFALQIMMLFIDIVHAKTLFSVGYIAMFMFVCVVSCSPRVVVSMWGGHMVSLGSHLARWW